MRWDPGNRGGAEGVDILSEERRIYWRKVGEGIGKDNEKEDLLRGDL